MLTYKKINLEDHADELFALDVASFNRPFDLPSRSVEETISYLSGSEIYLGYVNGLVVGLFAYKKNLGKIELKQLLVHPVYQKKGYGTMLLVHFLSLVKHERVWLVTHPKNTPALLVYLKQGFLVTGWKDNYYGDGQPRMILERE